MKKQSTSIMSGSVICYLHVEFGFIIVRFWTVFARCCSFTLKPLENWGPKMCFQTFRLPTFMDNQSRLMSHRWFISSFALNLSFHSCLQVVQTLEDHHQEVLSLYRDYGFAGLIAQDSEFALCNVPAYFSSHALKLSWNGKNLTTHQYLLSEAARQLGLKTHHLSLFAALLGEDRHIHLNSNIYQTTVLFWSFFKPEFLPFCRLLG